MIISLRGNNCSGKSTIVRKFLSKMDSSCPIYGCLGPAYPEAYRCEFECVVSPIFVLGPYRDQAHGGGDVITKKGVRKFIEVLDKYTPQGHVVFESILSSIRFMEPTLGGWLVEHKSEVVIAVLDVSLEQCLVDLAKRQEASKFSGGEKHIRRNHKDMGLSQKKFEERGFRMEYVTRDNAVDKMLSWFQSH